MENSVLKDKNLIKILKDEGIVVAPTDTIYGLLCLASSEQCVERIYKVKNRDRNKPCIILISNIKDLEKFEITLTKEQEKEILNKKEYPTSYILNCRKKKFEYLHCGTNTLSFRIPEKKDLVKLLKETGPLVAPSANFEGLPPAKNVKEAKVYFGNNVDLYVDGGEIYSSPSKIFKLKKDGTLVSFR